MAVAAQRYATISPLNGFPDDAHKRAVGMDAEVTAMISFRATAVGSVKQPLTVGAEYHEHRILCSWRAGLLLLNCIVRERTIL